jgi:hypothetical protein
MKNRTRSADRRTTFALGGFSVTVFSVLRAVLLFTATASGLFLSYAWAVSRHNSRRFRSTVRRVAGRALNVGSACSLPLISYAAYRFYFSDLPSAGGLSGLTEVRLIICALAGCLSILVSSGLLLIFSPGHDENTPAKQ